MPLDIAWSFFCFLFLAFFFWFCWFYIFFFWFILSLFLVVLSLLVALHMGFHTACEIFRCTECSGTILSLAAVPILSPSSSRFYIDNLIGCIGVLPNLAGTCWNWPWTLPLMWPLDHLPSVDPKALPLSCSMGWGCCGFVPGWILCPFSLVWE